MRHTMTPATIAPQFAVLAASDGGIIQWVSVRPTLEEAQLVIAEIVGNDAGTDEALFIVPLSGFVQFA